MKMVQYTSLKPSHKSTTQTVANKYLKLHIRRLRDREYSRLRAMVPSIAKKEKVSKVTVIEEAVKYIDELHQALIQRLNSKGLQSGVVNENNVKEFIQSLMPQNYFHKDEPTSSYEKQQKVPSFHFQRKQRAPKSL